MLETFEGGSALSDFRRLSLLKACRMVVPELKNIEATFFYDNNLIIQTIKVEKLKKS